MLRISDFFAKPESDASPIYQVLVILFPVADAVPVFLFGRCLILSSSHSVPIFCGEIQKHRLSSSESNKNLFLSYLCNNATPLSSGQLHCKNSFVKGFKYLVIDLSGFNGNKFYNAITLPIS